MRNGKFKTCAFAVTKMVLFSLLLSLILILLLALIARWASLSSAVIVPINYVIKIISVLVGAMLGVGKKPMGAVNGGIGGAIYTALSYLMFAGLDGGFQNASFSWIDLLCLTVAGVISGIIAVNVRKPAMQAA
ncbi:MAG TPA: TIGR04086 family membrane protein [Clostridia bacterium]|nr:TIGR04086 family membrane protein [Clostridia bacterium]